MSHTPSPWKNPRRSSFFVEKIISVEDHPTRRPLHRRLRRLQRRSPSTLAPTNMTPHRRIAGAPSMQRETVNRFREQRQAIAEVRGAIDEHQEKLAETHRLIVKLANGNAVRPLPLAASFTIPPIGRTTR